MVLIRSSIDFQQLREKLFKSLYFNSNSSNSNISSKYLFVLRDNGTVCLVKMHVFCEQSLECNLWMELASASVKKAAEMWNEGHGLSCCFLCCLLIYNSWFYIYPPFVPHLWTVWAPTAAIICELLFSYQSRCMRVSGSSCKGPFVHLTVHDVFWYMTVIHLMHMTQPSKTTFAKEKIHAPRVCFLQNNSNFVSLWNRKNVVINGDGKLRSSCLGFPAVYQSSRILWLWSARSADCRQILSCSIWPSLC